MSSNVPFEKNVSHIFFTSVNHICDLHFFTFAAHFILQTHIFEWFIAHLRSYWPKDYRIQMCTNTVKKVVHAVECADGKRCDHIFSHFFTYFHILSHFLIFYNIKSNFVM